MTEVDYIGIITAMRNEFGFVKKIIESIKSKRENGFKILIGTYNGIPIILIKSGVGHLNAEKAITHIAKNYPISLLINLGIAGSLKPGVNIGDVIIGERILLEQDNNSHSENICEDIPNRMKEILKGFISKRNTAYNYGAILTVKKPVLSSKRKKELYNTYGAECVDMEAGVIAKICALFEIPFLSIKVISDHADFLSHPLLIAKKIVALMKNMRLALSKLRPLLEEILDLTA